ncbi:MAG TPA: hypothetical protein PK605_06840 [Ignavibacteria bacterium]|nr:hypothetical protein [Bacteroidota bacterium]HRE09533.1 hypothetical protein [Ignavibacteria bacterium]HRF64447.1 hypothetical protein [Ignavibacteria bacterium]HRJ04102.1 hypothetical protein [Ignavibacteria bacterium]HRJ85802.1 hypothetical protein [Ignavibacteria bacterium]
MNDAAITAKKYFPASNIKSVEYVSPVFARKYKIAVFTPLKNADELTFKMSAAGAGNIGKYSMCSFRTEGSGTFRGSSSSKPFAGKKGRFEMVEEVRLEMICEQNDLEKVINTVYAIHPYEEPVCEIYPVIVRDTKVNKNTALIHFKRPLSVKDFLKKAGPKITAEPLPAKFLKTSVHRALIDLTGKTEYEIKPLRTKTLVIRKNNNIINFEVI